MAPKPEPQPETTEPTVTEASTEAPTDMVYMKHPQVGGVAGPVRRSAFESLWQHKGWQTTDERPKNIPA